MKLIYLYFSNLSYPKCDVNNTKQDFFALQTEKNIHMYSGALKNIDFNVVFEILGTKP